MCICIFSSGCRKEGCRDFNADNYDGDAAFNNNDLCTYRYLNSITVSKLNFFKAPINGWDDYYLDGIEGEEGFGPDLKFYLRRKVDADFFYWDITTPVNYDVFSLPFTWELPIQQGVDYLLYNQEYEYKLVDVDLPWEETIISGSFMPAYAYKENKIILTNTTETVQVELNYVVF